MCFYFNLITDTHSTKLCLFIDLITGVYTVSGLCLEINLSTDVYMRVGILILVTLL